MTKKIIISLCFFLFINSLKAQFDVEYFENLANAQISFNKKDYNSSIEFYNILKKEKENEAILIGLTEALLLNSEIDSAFQTSIELLNNGYFFLDGWKENESFDKFNSKQIFEIKELSKNNKLQYIIKQKNSTLVDALFQLFYQDQEIRRQMMQAIFKYGMFANEVIEINSKMIGTDSITFISIKRMIEKTGVPLINEIGKIGSHTFFTMLQHTNDNFMISIYPMVKKSFKKNEMNAVDFHYFQDRVFMYQGKPQIFGSQWEVDMGNKDTYKLYKVKNLKKANRLRSKHGKLPLYLEVKVLNSEGGTIKYEL